MGNAFESMPKKRFALPSMMIMLGIFFVVAAACTLAFQLFPSSHIDHTSGIVVGFRNTYKTVGGSYHAIVTFRTTDGKDVRFEDNTGSSHIDYDQNERVSVLYDPRDPEGSAQIDGFMNRWFAFCVTAFLGVVWLSIGFAASYVDRRTRPHQNTNDTFTPPMQKMPRISSGRPPKRKSRALSVKKETRLIIACFAAGLFAVATACGTGAYLSLRNQLTISRTYLGADGIVTGNVRYRSGHTRYAALITFVSQTGQAVTFEENRASSHARDRGDHVPIRYDPNTPQRAVVDSVGGRYVGIGIASFFALLTLTLAIFLCVKNNWHVGARPKQSA